MRNLQLYCRGLRLGILVEFGLLIGLPACAQVQGPLPDSVPASAVPVSTAASVAVAVHVDLTRRQGALVPVYNWFGYDEANYTTTPNGRALLGELHDLSPVPVYVRAHHLLTSVDGINGIPELKWSSTGVYHEAANGKPVYDFGIIDGIFDSYKAAGVRPMVELGFMPKDLAATLPNRHEPYQVHFPASTISGASNNPPKDYGKWRDLVQAVTAHLVQRYGAETVRLWPFEVWNEPDIDYWHTSAQEYWKLYDFAVDGVRAALPGAMVGGPASTGPGGRSGGPFLEGFLTHVDAGKSAATGGPVPLDFISFHAKGQPVFASGQVTMGLRSELQDADKGFAIVASHPRLRALPIILSEADPEGCAACSSKMNPANNYRNGTLYPAYTAAAYKALVDLARRRGVNLISMLSWSFEFEGREYFEGFRSLATNRVDKPVLNLFRMLGLLDGTRVETSSTGALSLDALLASGVRSRPDVDALGSAGENSAAILLWNYGDSAATSLAAEVAAEVEGLPSTVRRVQVTQYRIDDHHSNAYTVWQAMGSPQHPTEQQITALRSRAGLELLSSPVWMNAENGKVTVQTEMPGESVELLQVRW